MRGGSLLTDDGQSPLECGQGSAAIFGHENIVLDADTELAYRIEAGLVGEDHAGFEHLPVATHDVRRFVDLAPHSVTCLGANAIGEFRRLENLGYGIVDIVRRHPRAGYLVPYSIRLEHSLVDPVGFVVRMADKDRSRNVGNESSGPRAKIEQQRVACPDRIVLARRSMRPGRVVTRRDNRCEGQFCSRSV